MEYKKILVVDDEPLMRDFLVETLQRKKYLVEAVGSGSQAIEKLKTEYSPETERHDSRTIAKTT